MADRCILEDPRGQKYIAGVTHNTTFHSDDVFSAALLNYVAAYQAGETHIVPGRITMFPIHRVGAAMAKNIVANKPDIIVFDIGDSEFDHHLAPRETRPNGVPYSGFGKLWRLFGPELCYDDDFRAIFDRDFVQQIDLNDNEGIPNLFSVTISMMNTANPKNDAAQSIAFRRAVKWAHEVLCIHLENLWKRQAEALPIRRAESRINAHGKSYVVFDTYMKAINVEALRPQDLVMIYPHSRGGWAVEKLSDRPNATTVVARWLAPEKFWGKPAEELRAMEHGMKFCHATGFLSTFDTVEDAIAFVDKYVI